MERKFKKTILPSGVRVVSEYHPEARSVALGIWANLGTRHEPADQVGISHLLEHMVFKGTKTRSAFQISKSLEALGGDLNAFTSREHTCYHALVLKDFWLEAFDVLSDLTTQMQFSKKDFLLEKNVIIQEIAMSEESPEDFVYDLFFETCYHGNPLGRSILGSMKTISKMSMGQIYKHYRSHYLGDNLLVSAAGNIDHEELVQEARKIWGHKRKPLKKVRLQRPRWRTERRIKEKDTEQVHFLVGLPFPGMNSSLRFHSIIVNAALGGGMTSRLYQSIREKRGLAYSIYSSVNTFADTGLLNIYAGVDGEKLEKLVELVKIELLRLKKVGLKPAEVESYKTQVIGHLLLGADDTDNRMNSIAINEFVFGKYNSPEHIVEKIKSISAKEINQFIREWIKPEKITGVLMGSDLSTKLDWWKKVSFE
jgi:predicted Zn-dependent peptidase